MNILQDKLKKHTPLTKDIAAKYLAVAGEKFDNEIYERMAKYVEKYPKASIFHLSIIESYVWAMYAKRKDHFFDLCLRYFQDDDETIFNSLDSLVHRFAPDKLEDGIRSWKTVLASVKIELGEDFTASKLKDYQQNHLFPQVIALRKTRKISRLGPWLFTAPFKITAIYKKDLWQQEELDELYMPLGLQVNKGFRLLAGYGISEAVSAVTEIDEEGDFLTGMSDIIESMIFQKELAKLANSRVLHINSGLHRLGGKDD